MSWKGLLFFCLLCCLGCIDEIPVETGDAPSKLVVSGQLNNLNEKQEVQLHFTQGYGKLPLPIAGATITLYENDIKLFEYEDQGDGVYTSGLPSFSGKIGCFYHIIIKLLNGETYQSIPEKMLEPIYPKSVSWDVRIENQTLSDGYVRPYQVTALKINVDFPKADSSIRLKWNVSGAFQFTTLPECNPFRTTRTCYFSNPLNQGSLMIYSNADTRLNGLTNFEIGFEDMEPNYKFMETHYFSVYQQRITSAAYEYYNQLKLISTQNGSIFDPLPATVRGNIYKMDNASVYALGYFQIASIGVIHERVTAADYSGKYSLLSKTGNLCAWLYGGLNSYFGACCDCNLPEPIISKPDWW